MKHPKPPKSLAMVPVAVILTPLQIGAIIDAVVDCAMDGFPDHEVKINASETWGDSWKSKREAALNAIEVLHYAVAKAIDFSLNTSITQTAYALGVSVKAAAAQSRARAKTRKSSLTDLRTYSGPVHPKKPTKASAGARGRSTAKRAHRSSKASGR